MEESLSFDEQFPLENLPQADERYKVCYHCVTMMMGLLTEVQQSTEGSFESSGTERDDVGYVGMSTYERTHQHATEGSG